MTELRENASDMSVTYPKALAVLTDLALTLRPAERDAYATMANARAAITGAAKDVPDTQVLKDIGNAVTDTVWEDFENRIVERPVHLRVVLWTCALEVYGCFGMRFFYHISGSRKNHEGWAKLTPDGDEEWALITDETSWLHEHRAEHGLSDPEIDQLHENVNARWRAGSLRFRDGRPDD